MSEMIERGAEAMRVKRRELINQPLDRIWPDLMRAAIAAVRDTFQEMAHGAEFQSDPEYELFTAVEVIDKALGKVPA